MLRTLNLISTEGRPATVWTLHGRDEEPDAVNRTPRATNREQALEPEPAAPVNRFLEQRVRPEYCLRDGRFQWEPVRCRRLPTSCRSRLAGRVPASPLVTYSEHVQNSP